MGRYAVNDSRELFANVRNATAVFLLVFSLPNLGLW